MTITEPFPIRLQKRISFLAIGRSAMRNQGPKYMVRQARLFTSAINLTEMANFWNQKRYVSYLDDQTIKLMAFFPKGARRNFGAARKALNLFFRDILYNSRLVQHYELNTSIHYLSQLEIPLDNQTAKKIIEAVPTTRKNWKGIKYLLPGDNTMLQDTATGIAIENQIARVDLDVYFWNPDKF